MKRQRQLTKAVIYLAIACIGMAGWLLAVYTW